MAVVACIVLKGRDGGSDRVWEAASVAVVAATAELAWSTPGSVQKMWHRVFVPELLGHWNPGEGR